MSDALTRFSLIRMIKFKLLPVVRRPTPFDEVEVHNGSSCPVERGNHRRTELDIASFSLRGIKDFQLPPAEGWPTA